MHNKYKVLVVDDAQSVLTVIREILEDEYIVKTARSGEEGLAIIPDFKPDMILLDVTMHGIDGYEVCRRVRQDGIFGFIKIIMVSGRTMLEERLKGYEAGADDYIGKPFKPEELLAKVRVFMRLKSVEDQLHDLNKELNDQVRMRTEQLVDAERMAAIGRYAAGIVHNLNNPLQVIMGNAELLAVKNPDNRNIMNLRKAAAQMKKIISTILSTSYRESNTEYVPIDLNELLKDQVELLRSNTFFKHKVKTELILSPIPGYRGIYHHFSQSLGNLIKNAVDAMYKSPQRILHIETSLEKEYIRIEIRDTGHGISDKKMDKIFNPFFTTKPLTAKDERPTGTGLGLASAKEMIESYDGRILVESEEGKGTSFIILLPLP
ncbi:MAG: response regulator [Desulfococcaceae bacterium]|jgi:signal transduction histidine kinase|nr:response regulator [Desulfococcaceae bacterium]